MKTMWWLDMTYYPGQGGWLRGLEPSLHDRPSLEIWPSETEYHLPSKQIWRRMQTWRDDEFLLGFEFSRVQTPRKDFKIIFNGICGHQEASCMNGSWVITLIVTDSASRQVQLFISFVNFRATSLVSISYIFPPTVVLRTLFLILNICYELTILVWVLQQSCGNVH